jgi:hypothetical protein
MGFGTAASTSYQMAIDSSGSLLAGKTSADFGSTEGLEVRTTGNAYITAQSVQPLRLRRTSTDGDIAVFQKDTTTVGSIGSLSGVVTKIVLDPRTNGASLTGGTNKISPGNQSGALDAHLDLGSINNRFKDLYLSGGAYLGGTGSANHLDDYEEGTWTPVITGSTTAGAFTYSIQEGKYTKVGNLVSVNCAIYVTATSTSPVGSTKITGLPFTINNQFPSFTVGWSQFITFTDQLSAYGGATQITLRDTISGGSGSNIQGSAFGSAFYIFVSGTYQA